MIETSGIGVCFFAGKEANNMKAPGLQSAEKVVLKGIPQKGDFVYGDSVSDTFREVKGGLEIISSKIVLNEEEGGWIIQLQASPVESSVRKQYIGGSPIFVWNANSIYAENKRISMQLIKTFIQRDIVKIFRKQKGRMFTVEETEAWTCCPGGWLGNFLEQLAQDGIVAKITFRGEVRGYCIV
jgi:hypothetical protein